MDTIFLYYGKIDKIVEGMSAGEEKGRRETLAGKRLLLLGLREQYGITFPKGEEGIACLEKCLGKGVHGKPYLMEWPKVHFNISHSGEYAVCALASFPVGVDIQFIKPLKSLKLMERTMSQEEQQIIENSENPAREFCFIWAQKESYLKWTGDGISCDLRTIEWTGWQERFLLEQEYAGCVCAAQPCQINTLIYGISPPFLLI